MHILSMKYMDFSNCLTKWRAFVSHKYGFSIVFFVQKPQSRPMASQISKILILVFY